MNDSLGNAYLSSVIKRMLTYKALADFTFGQLEEKDFFFVPAPGSNSIAVIIQHMAGNMISRWTNFLTEDGEKEGRDRDKEFAADKKTGRTGLLELWEKGWNCLLGTLQSLQESDLLKTIHIRHEPLLAVDAINRQLAHYPHHVGQIIYIGKMIKGNDWKSPSIAKGDSAAFNKMMADLHLSTH